MVFQAGEFSGKVVLVTGAGRGIGRLIAQTFAKQGAWIACNDLLPINLDQTMAEIKTQGGVAVDYIYDVAKRLTVRAMVDQILANWGRIDLLINSASVRPKASFLEMDEWDWQRTIDVNLSGPFYTIQTVGRVMKEQSGGAIINLAISEPSNNLAGQAGYLSSKTGMLGLTYAAAVELAPFNIRVNAIVSGLPEYDAPLIRTDRKQVLEKYPTDSEDVGKDPGRIITGLALHLASKSSGHINGQIIEVATHQFT